jgi:phage tail-like protein
MHMPAQGTATNITLKKGLVRGRSVPTLYSWINSIQFNQVEKQDIFVRLCDEQGAAVISWKVTNAFPTKLDAPTFDANSNDVAIESMELMADGIFIEEA